jgi:hypothetical protein
VVWTEPEVRLALRVLRVCPGLPGDLPVLKVLPVLKGLLVPKVLPERLVPPGLRGLWAKPDRLVPRVPPVCRVPPDPKVQSVQPALPDLLALPGRRGL